MENDPFVLTLLFLVCVCVCVWFRGTEPLKDSVVSTYEEHEDSVYAAEWSSADPWLFASLSYDGRLVINRVPRALKYRILLWGQRCGHVRGGESVPTRPSAYAVKHKLCSSSRLFGPIRTIGPTSAYNHGVVQ